MTYVIGLSIKTGITLHKKEMKRIFILAVCLGFTFTAMSQDNYKLKSSTMKIEGTSSLHDWSAEANKVTGTVNFSENDLTTALQNVSIEIEVNAIKSEKGSAMDNNIYSALKAKSNPKITFQMTKVNSIKGQISDFNALVTGNLTIAGTTKLVELNVKGRKSTNGNLVFNGVKKIKMTDFNVKPPSFMFGAMKTGDEVTITFSTTFSK